MVPHKLLPNMTTRHTQGTHIFNSTSENKMCSFKKYYIIITWKLGADLS